MPRRPRSYIEPGVVKRVTRSEAARTEAPEQPSLPSAPIPAPHQATRGSAPKPAPAAKPKTKSKANTTAKKSQASSKKLTKRAGSKLGPAAKRVKGPLDAEEPPTKDEADVGSGAEDGSGGDGKEETLDTTATSAPGNPSSYMFSSWPEAAAIITKQIGRDDTSLEQFGYRPKNVIRRSRRIAETQVFNNDNTQPATTSGDSSIINITAPAAVPTVVPTSDNSTTTNKNTNNTGRNGKDRRREPKKKLATVSENCEAQPEAELPEKEITLDYIVVNTDSLYGQPSARRSAISPRTRRAISQPPAGSETRKPPVFVGLGRQTGSYIRPIQIAPTAALFSTSAPKPASTTAPRPTKRQKMEPVQKETAGSQRQTRSSARPRNAATETPDPAPAPAPPTPPPAGSRRTKRQPAQSMEPQRPNRASTKVPKPTLKRRLEEEQPSVLTAKKSKMTAGRQSSSSASPEEAEIRGVEQTHRTAPDPRYGSAQLPPTPLRGGDDRSVNGHAHYAAAVAPGEPQRGISPESTHHTETQYEVDEEEQDQAAETEPHVLFFAYDKLMAEEQMVREYSDDVVPYGVGKLEGWRFCFAGPRRLGIPPPNDHEISGEGYANIVRCPLESSADTTNGENTIPPPIHCVYGRVYSVPMTVWGVLEQDLLQKHHGATTTTISDPIDIMRGVKHDKNGNVVPLREQHKYRNHRLGGLHDATTPEWAHLADPLEYQETLHDVLAVCIPTDMYHAPERGMTDAATSAGYHVMQSYYGEQDKVTDWGILLPPHNTKAAQARRLSRINLSPDIQMQSHLLRDHERQAYIPILRANQVLRYHTLQLGPQPPVNPARMLLDLRPQLEATKKIFLAGKLLRTTRRRQIQEDKMAMRILDWMKLSKETRQQYKTRENWEKKTKRGRRMGAANTRAAAAAAAAADTSQGEDNDDFDDDEEEEQGYIQNEPNCVEGFDEDTPDPADDEDRGDLQPRLASVRAIEPTYNPPESWGSTKLKVSRPCSSWSRPHSLYKGYDLITEEEEELHKRYVAEWNRTITHLKLERLIPTWYIAEELRAWIPLPDPSYW